MILNDILHHKRLAVEALKARYPQEKLHKRAAGRRAARRSLAHAIERARDVALIAELKKASPSEGLLRANFQLTDLAECYAAAGVAAISVLTDAPYFRGRISYLKKVRQVCACPVLRKDFLIDRAQVYESAIYEADAVLLIAALLSAEELDSFHALSAELGMEALVEVHSREDIDKAVAAGARLIGINHRNLETFEMDPDRTAKLIGCIPNDCWVVAESGIQTRQDILALKSLGADAVLVGSSLMKARDVSEKLGLLMGKAGTSCA